MRLVVETLRANLRSYDVIVRYGGDEFLCVMPSFTRSAAEDRQINTRYRELDEREARLDERDKRVTDRETGASSRDDRADEREAQTDSREREQMERDARVSHQG